jgi:hypothetical protein
MAALVLGPILRYADSDSATIWVETDAACTVAVHAGERDPDSSRTFQVSGHHYAIIAVRGLTAGSVVPYSVALDGEPVWPVLKNWPPSVLRPYEPGRRLRIAFGSCRAAAPLDDDEWGIDALHALAERIRGDDPRGWPDLLAFVGDQVYADDNLSPETLAYIQQHRGPDEGTGHEVGNVDEYTHLYAESWSPEPIRWLLSTIPSAMIFDDHDVRDDWNTSVTWRRDIQRQPWWHERITSGLLTYWLYQHLGNLSPDELDADATLAALRAAAGDGEPLLRALAERADAAADGAPGERWSYRRDYGRVRFAVLDSRCNRVVDGRQRLMVSDREWEWFDRQCTGDVDHLVIVTSLPYLLPSGVHGLEAFDEAIAAGQWGRRAARLAEKVRQGADLEHWAAFETSFRRLRDLVTAVAEGRRGKPPASVIFLSGDVHFSYLAEAKLGDGKEPARGSRTRVLQAVCSPIRNPLDAKMRMAERIATSAVGRLLGRILTGRAHATTPGLRWNVTRGPAFGNTLGELTLDGRAINVSLSAAVAGPGLEEAWSASFTP